MLSRFVGLKATLATLALCGGFGLATPALAQNAPSNDTGMAGPNTHKTGVEPRGTPVGPSTQPGQHNGQASSANESRTGVGQRGTTVAPSTNPATKPGHHADRD